MVKKMKKSLCSSLTAVLLLLTLAACERAPQQASSDAPPDPSRPAIPAIEELGFSQENELPGGTRLLGLYGAGYLKEEDAYYVVVQAQEEDYTPLSDGVYAFKLHPDRFYASLWEPFLAGAQSPANYHDAENFYSLYCQETEKLCGELPGASCTYYFEDGLLANLSESRVSPGIDITTGEPLDE